MPKSGVITNTRHDALLKKCSQSPSLQIRKNASLIPRYLTSPVDNRKDLCSVSLDWRWAYLHVKITNITPVNTRQGQQTISGWHNWRRFLITSIGLKTTVATPPATQPEMNDQLNGADKLQRQRLVCVTPQISISESRLPRKWHRAWLLTDTRGKTFSNRNKHNICNYSQFKFTLDLPCILNTCWINWRVTVLCHLAS